jgi:hypothetical protein
LISGPFTAPGTAFSRCVAALIPGTSPRGVVPALVCVGLAIGSLPAFHARAQVTGFELEVTPLLELEAPDGALDAGSFERFSGRVTGMIDPTEERNARITNLDLAPLNADGLVEYSVDIEFIRPADPSHRNGSLLVSIPGDGLAPVPDPMLLEMGFMHVSIGWRGDLEPGEGRLVADLPVARGADGSRVTSVVREEFIFEDAEPVVRARLTYPAVATGSTNGSLTVRRFQYGQRQTPDDLSWRYVDAATIEIERSAAFGPGAIHEFVYEAADPIVLGIGFAAVRDVVALLARRHAGDPSAPGTPDRMSPLADVAPSSVIGSGTGPGARFLRDFLHLGFNESLGGEPVFDGLLIRDAGAARTSANMAFGQPGRVLRQHEDHLFPGVEFPFTYTTLTDPISGATDGLLERCSASDTCPHIIHADGELEYWQGRASLVVTDPVGGPIELPEGVRIYAIAGAGSPAPEASTSDICLHPVNRLDTEPVQRALTVSLLRWIEEDSAPPASRFPSVAERELLVPRSTGFANVDGVVYTAFHNPLYLLDHETIPPEVGEAYTILVPRIDGDGNMIDGIRLPDHLVPEGTYTGWNVRDGEVAGGELCGGEGSFFRFPEMRSSRIESFDRRRSFQERYSTPEVHMEAVSWAVDELLEEGFLLPEDAEAILLRASQREWGSGR